MTKKHLSVYFVLALVLMGAVFVLLKNKKSTEAAGGQSFGGKVTSTEECSCSDGYQVTVSGGGNSNGTYLYTSSSQNQTGGGAPSSNQSILGLYTSGGTCMVEGDPCTELEISKGTISSFGTSQ